MNIKVKLGNVLEISHVLAGKNAYLVTNSSIKDNRNRVQHYIGLSNLDNGNRYTDLFKVENSFDINKIKLKDEFVDNFVLYNNHKEYINSNRI